MALSEIRVNTTKTRTGVGTITYTETGPVITGIATASNFKTGSTNVHSTGVELSNINTGGSTATFGGAISGTTATLSGALSGSTATFSGNVSIGGTLTYEDVTNIDAVGIVTARDHIHIKADNKQLKIGAHNDGDMLSYHDGTKSVIVNYTGDFHLRSNNGSRSSIEGIILKPNGSTELYHSGNKKLHTFTNGVTVTGNLYATDTIYCDDTSDNGSSKYVGAGAGKDIRLFHTGSENHLKGTGAHPTIFSTDGDERLRITSAGRVGIATITPSAKLEIYEPVLSGDEILLHLKASPLKNVYQDISSDANRRGVIRFKDSDGTYRWSIGNGDSDELSNASFHISSGNSGGNTAKFIIDSGGRMGLGVTPTASHSNVTSMIQFKDGNTIFSRTGGQFLGLFQNIKYTSGDVTRYVINGLGSAYFQTAGEHKFYTAPSGTANTNATLVERLRINSAGRLKINHNQTPGQLDDTWLSIYDANSDNSANDPAGISKNYAMIALHNYGTGSPGDVAGIGFGAGSSFTYTKGSIGFERSGSYGRGDLVFCTNDDGDTTLVNNTDERLRIKSDGRISINETSHTSQAQLTIKNTNDFNSASISTNSDNIFLISDATSGDGVYGASIGFSRVQYPDRRAAAIVTVQEGSDEDFVGLAFFTHDNADATAAIVEKLRIEPNGRINAKSNSIKFYNSATNPSNPENGDTYYNSQYHELKTYVNGEWKVAAGQGNVVSTGSTTVYTSGGNKYISHAVTSSGIVTVTGQAVSVDYMLIAGGAGGGCLGGGGGAGGVIVGTGKELEAGEYSVTIGGGGLNGGDNVRGGAGGNSTAFGFTSIGGGGGGSHDGGNISVSGGNGGSGGGGSDNNNNYGPGSGTSGQGNNGGNGSPVYTSGNRGGGGGGGAGAVGKTYNTLDNGNYGNGGIGIQNAFETGSNHYYAGGGGRSGYGGSNNHSGDGGHGGGGGGSMNTSNGNRGDAGLASANGRQGQDGGAGGGNRGGGGGQNTGGGAGSNAWNLSGGNSGGSGILVIRYQIA